jgi:hypothetical protein
MDLGSLKSKNQSCMDLSDESIMDLKIEACATALPCDIRVPHVGLLNKHIEHMLQSLD